jgi:hypothetical protein
LKAIVALIPQQTFAFTAENKTSGSGCDKLGACWVSHFCALDWPKDAMIAPTSNKSMRFITTSIETVKELFWWTTDVMAIDVPANKRRNCSRRGWRERIRCLISIYQALRIEQGDEI